MRITGLLTIIALCAIPLIWLPGIGQNRDTIALFSQYLGMISLILMASAQIIATRVTGVEVIFGPMDRAYVLHKWLGIVALAAMFLHDTIDAEMRGLGRETVLVEVAETAGEISLYAILILVVITIATFIPYHLWRWTHRFMGLFFAFAAFHYLFILKPFSNTDPLGLYMGVLCGLGILAYLYTLLPALRPAHQYTVTKVMQDGAATSIEMSPTRRGLRHRAGQFAVFSFDATGLREPHPFTISSAPDDARGLRITAARLGDYTHRLGQQVAVGQSVSVEGPFGHFTLPHGDRPQVWIAAGIGITPFVALAKALPDSGPEVHLIICCRRSEDVAHLEELKALAVVKPNLTLALHESATSGRLSEEALLDYAPKLGMSKVLFCGPVVMRRTLATILSRHGVSQRDFHYEEFEFRTGIGLQRLSETLRARLSQT